ncbi:MAG: MlaD family protein [Spirochaetota bacterium]|nr:MlaD family protein [Spirochaetota bacterium]
MKKELKVGIFVLIALICFFIAVIFIKDFKFGASGQKYIITFSFLNNLMEGGNVKLNGGINIGEISNLELEGQKASVKIIITKPTINTLLMDKKNPAKVKFSIRSAGVLGEKYILLEFDDKLGEPFNFVDSKGKKLEIPIIEGKEAADFENIISKLDSITEKIDKFLVSDLVDIIKQIKSYVKSKKIDEIIDNVVNASSKLNKLMDNSNLLVSDIRAIHLTRTFNSLNNALTTVNTEAKIISESINSLVKTSKDGIKDLFDHNQGIPAVARETKTALENINSLIVTIKTVIANMNNSNTPIGTLVKDENVARDLKKIIKNLTELTDQLKKNPLFSDKKKYRPGPF